MKRKSTLRKTIGNIFIITSLLILLFIYYPVAMSYLLSSKVALNTGFSIEIPKIKLVSPIIKGVDATNEKEYRKALTMGIAQAKGSALPGDKGTIFLFGHSTDYPWNLTRYNTIFLRLDELKKNDLILIEKDGKKYKYYVTDKKVVWPNEVKYIKENKDQLILQTCTPIGTAFQRLLVFASPVK